MVISREHKEIGQKYTKNLDSKIDPKKSNVAIQLRKKRKMTKNYNMAQSVGHHCMIAKSTEVAKIWIKQPKLA